MTKQKKTNRNTIPEQDLKTADWSQFPTDRIYQTTQNLVNLSGLNIEVLQ